MEWFNLYGLIIMTIIMIPNIIYACKVNSEKTCFNKSIEKVEQISRFGCFALMIFNIPYTYINFYFKGALYVYLIVNSILLLFYILIWIICFNEHSLFKAYSLSIAPTLIFIVSSVLLGYIPLFIFSIIFGICHITISVNNFKSI